MWIIITINLHDLKNRKKNPTLDGVSPLWVSCVTFCCHHCYYAWITRHLYTWLMSSETPNLVIAASHADTSADCHWWSSSPMAHIPYSCISGNSVITGISAIIISLFATLTGRLGVSTHVILHSEAPTFSWRKKKNTFLDWKWGGGG